MTSSDDYPVDMSESIPQQRDGLDDSTIQALLGARSRARSAEFGELAGVLTELRAVVDVPAPAPSPELAAMLEVGLPELRRVSGTIATPKLKNSRGRVRRALVLAGLTSLVSVPVMGVAAAQDRLPDAAQHLVATVIEATTPFTVADPHVDPVGENGSKKSPKQTGNGKSPQIVPPVDGNGRGLDNERPTVGADRQGDRSDPSTGPGNANGKGPPSSRPSVGPFGANPGVSPPTDAPLIAYDSPAPSPSATSKRRSGSLATPKAKATRARQVGQQSVSTSEPTSEASPSLP